MPPALDPDTRERVLAELGRIGNNINQIARHANSGIIAGIQKDIAEVHKQFLILKHFLNRDYGDPVDLAHPPGALS